MKERIEQALIEMQKTLLEVNSARNQVNEVVSSNQRMSASWDKYLKTINDISENLSDIINTINEDYLAKQEQFKQDNNAIIMKSNEVMKELQDTSADFHNSILQEQEAQNKQRVFMRKIFTVLIILCSINTAIGITCIFWLFKTVLH